jgi:hypothetical protein
MSPSMKFLLEVCLFVDCSCFVALQQAASPTFPI